MAEYNICIRIDYVGGANVVCYISPDKEVVSKNLKLNGRIKKVIVHFNPLKCKKLYSRDMMIILNQDCFEVESIDGYEYYIDCENSSMCEVCKLPKKAIKYLTNSESIVEILKELYNVSVIDLRQERWYTAFVDFILDVPKEYDTKVLPMTKPNFIQWVKHLIIRWD